MLRNNLSAIRDLRGNGRATWNTPSLCQGSITLENQSDKPYAGAQPRRGVSSIARRACASRPSRRSRAGCARSRSHIESAAALLVMRLCHPLTSSCEQTIIERPLAGLYQAVKVGRLRVAFDLEHESVVDNRESGLRYSTRTRLNVPSCSATVKCRSACPSGL